MAAFLRGDTDDDRIAALVRGLILLDWAKVPVESQAERLPHTPSEPTPNTTFALLKICHSSSPVREVHVPLEPTIARLLAAGRLDDAAKLAARRLRGSGLPPAISVAGRSGTQSRRL